MLVRVIGIFPCTTEAQRALYRYLSNLCPRRTPADTMNAPALPYETTPKPTPQKSATDTQLWLGPMSDWQFSLWPGCASSRRNLSDNVLARVEQGWCSGYPGTDIPHLCLHRFDSGATRLEIRHYQHCGADTVVLHCETAQIAIRLSCVTGAAGRKGKNTDTFRNSKVIRSTEEIANLGVVTLKPKPDVNR